MSKLYDYIIKNYDSDRISYIEKISFTSLEILTDYGLNAEYLDDINILEFFHNVYLEVRDDFDEEIVASLKEISDKYLFFVDRIKEYLKFRNFNRSNYSVDHYPINVRDDYLDYVKDNVQMFSLSELFNLRSFDTICGVCLISPVQTVCMFNDDLFGYIGSGYHNDSFYKIVKSIYSEAFIQESGGKSNCITGQDIRISFSNGFGLSRCGTSWRIRVTLEVPVPITSSQKDSLKILNDEIKKYQKNNDVSIEVISSLLNYYDEDFFTEFLGRNDLDDVLKWAIVCDDYDFQYKDKNIVGFINGENHFNDSDYKLSKKLKISRK